MDNDIKPKVTVLMPVYNGEKYLGEAIESILNQTFRDFELLIIDDGSTDKSAEIIKSYEDNRIKYVPNDRNMGLPYSLNRGLDLSTGEYIARMDADDISLPKRLEKQVEFMEKNADITVCGTWVKTFGTERRELVHKYFTDPNDVKAGLLFNTSLAHPSVIIRKSDLDKSNLRYETNYKYFEEDYDLWVKVREHYKLSNLPEVLLRYRLHNKSVTHINTENRKVGISAIRQKQLETLGLQPDAEDMRIHNSVYPNTRESTHAFLEKEELWLSKILDANMKTNIYKTESLNGVIYTRWYLLCMANKTEGLISWKKFDSSKLSKLGGSKKVIDSLKIFVRALLIK